MTLGYLSPPSYSSNYDLIELVFPFIKTHNWRHRSLVRMAMLGEDDIEVYIRQHEAASSDLTAARLSK